MLKTTYQSAAASGKAALPAGWTEHKAPSGHLYYYHAETKKSTYTRPKAQQEQQTQQLPSEYQSIQSAVSNQGGFTGANATPVAFKTRQGQNDRHSTQANGSYPLSQQHQQRQHEHRRKTQPEDRPKHKQKIPKAAPWVLVKTKLRRRFVHNPDTGESLWKFPKDVMACVVEMDRAERERKHRRAKGEYSDEEEEVFEPSKKAERSEVGKIHDHDSEEYEEVEVTDEEAEDGQGAKRQKTDEPQAGPVEFHEDDIAYQLAQMEGLANADYDESYDAYQEAPQIAEVDAKALFMDLLNDYRISPFMSWDKIIDEGRLIEDDRYTILPNMKSRKETFDEWSRVKAQELNVAREEQAKQDPRVPYMSFLDRKATPKLYWPEFRRKYQKEPELKDRKLTDKDREKWYREHISRLKLPESKLKSELADLLRSIPARELHKDTSINALPSSILRDIRYISLPPKIRDPFTEAFIDTNAPVRPEEGEALSAEDEARSSKERVERDRREKALADRVEAVRLQKAKQRKDLGYSKATLREEEEEVNRAMKVGRDGLMGHFDAPQA